MPYRKPAARAGDQREHKALAQNEALDRARLRAHRHANAISRVRRLTA
jgi:hypothetical protein